MLMLEGMTIMADHLKQQVVQLAKAGKKKEAAQLVRDHVAQHPQDVNAWWLLANIVHHSKVKRHSLERVLALQPNHDQARQLLAKMDKAAAGPPKPGTQPNPAPPAASRSPFTVAPDAARFAPPQTPPVVDDDLPEPDVDDFFDLMEEPDTQAAPKQAPATTLPFTMTDNPFKDKTPATKPAPNNPFETAAAPAAKSDLVPLNFQLVKEKEKRVQAAKKGISDTTAYMIVGGLVVVALLLIAGIFYFYSNNQDSELALSQTASNDLLSLSYPDDWVVTQHDGGRIVISSRAMPTADIDPWFFLSDGINGMVPAYAFLDFVERPILNANGQDVQLVVVQPVPQTPQYLIDTMIQQVLEAFSEAEQYQYGVRVDIKTEKATVEMDDQPAEFTIMDADFRQQSFFAGDDQVHVGLYFAVTQHNDQHYLYTMMVFEEDPLDWRNEAQRIAESIDFQ